MKKTLIIILLIGLFAAPFAYAAGIVPCGQTTDDPYTDVKEDADCTLCHFFILIMSVVNFVLFRLAAPIALLMLIIGGAMFMLAAGNPTTITNARKLITSVLIGIVVIYGAYFIVGIFLQVIGLNPTWTEPLYSSWWNGVYEINCGVESVPAIPRPTP